MQTNEIRAAIENGDTALGLELGSTRIKAMLIGPDHAPLASGSHSWENRLVDKVWTYDIEDVWAGIRDCYADLARDVSGKYGVALKKTGAMGISAMMHGYMAFDGEDRLLVPFRTWRNTMTGEASEKLTSLFGFNIPQRWSIAHLYQAILNDEAHVGEIRTLTTLAGYVHWMLTGKKAVGVGEASGMFPIDPKTGDYDGEMMAKFDKLIEGKFPWTLRDILPASLPAGADAGRLTPEGAHLIDPTGTLESGIPFCPAEGDAGTGMVATNSVSPRTGNVSAGTSVFSMVVLEKALSGVHPEIDVVTTPSGDPVAMVHCNNCTSDLNAWVSLFGEFAGKMGLSTDPDALYGTLYRAAMDADRDAGGLVPFNYFSGESITGFDEGRPLFLRKPDSRFTLANFMRANLYSALAVLKIGNDILLRQEGVRVDSITGHGGLFKTKGVGQRILAAALDTPVSVMSTAGEGGPWGMAILAAFMRGREPGQSLADYLARSVFASCEILTESPDPEDVAGFDAFLKNYKACLPAERAAVECMK